MFEILSANYAQYFAPQYKWQLTKQVGDYNRDFETKKDVFFKWGEAKHTECHSTSVSKSRWDPTLLSAQLSNNVDLIFLITCGWIPLEYIVRAEHLRNNNSTIKKIAYINRDVLDKWLNNNNISFCDFGEKKFNISSAMCSIKKENGNPKVHSPKVIINIYGEYNNSMLEPQYDLEENVPYEVNITTFTSQEEFILKVNMPDSFKVIDNIRFKSLSSIDDDEDILFDNTIREFKLKIGYNQILIHGLFDSSAAGSSYTISAENHDSSILEEYTFNVIKQTVQSNKFINSEIINVENLYNESIETKQNNKILTKYLTKNDLIRQRGNNADLAGYHYYPFNDSYSENAKKLCQLASKFFFDVDLQDSDEKTIPIVFNSVKKYFDFYLLDLVIGSVNAVFALNIINNILSSEYSKHLIQTIPVSIPDRTMFFLEGVANLNGILRMFLELLLSVFTANTNASIIIADINPHHPIISDKGNSYQYPSNHTNTETIIDEMYTSNEGIDSNRILEESNKLYEKTDFYGAMFFYDYLYGKKYKDQTDLECLFKYADCLNHCGSMNKSVLIFKYISDHSYENSPYMRAILEAHTEVFNIRFWKMDTNGLIDDIDNFVKKYYNVLTSCNKGRDLYSYYNCLNRKMTTQYLIGDYNAADETYRQYVNAVDEQHLNYLAFAHMDSARGLYKKDIVRAQKRMLKAYDILNDLFNAGKEQRRFYDCAVEVSYIDFVIKYNREEHPNIDNIENAILNVKMNGYRNMLLKCYLKLSSCYLALNRVEDALKCMEFVKNNCDFSENTRVAVLYNSIKKNIYDVINHNILTQKPISKDFIEPSFTLKFNCDTNATILLETRIW